MPELAPGAVPPKSTMVTGCSEAIPAIVTSSRESTSPEASCLAAVPKTAICLLSSSGTAAAFLASRSALELGPVGGGSLRGNHPDIDPRVS